MPAKIFNEYAADCFDRMVKSLEKYSSTADNEQLSVFRVSIKKIRVSLACIEYYKGDKIHHIRRDLSKHFQRGGELRQLKIYRDWFNKNQLTLLRKATGIDATLLKMDAEFIHDINKSVTDIKKIQKQVSRHNDKLDQEKIFRFYVWLIRTELPLPLGKPTKDKWHRLRKKIKRVLYARHWQDGVGLRLISNQQAKFLDKLQHLFGYWHDNEDMYEWVKDKQEKCNDDKDSKSRAAFKRALLLLKNRSGKYVVLINNRLTRVDNVLRPLENRLEKIKAN